MCMSGLFDDEVAGLQVGDPTPAKDGALFPEDSQAHLSVLAGGDCLTDGGCQPARGGPTTLFADDVVSQSTPPPKSAPIASPGCKADDINSVTALPLDETPTVSQRSQPAGHSQPAGLSQPAGQKPSSAVVMAAPLPLDDLPTAPQAILKTIIQPVTLAPAAATAPQRSVTSTPQPQEVFQEPEDPLVHKALQHAQEKYPDVFERKKRILKARFETLLPLDFDKISAFSAGTLPHVQVVLREVSESSQNLSALSVSTTIQEITTAARDAAARVNAGGHSSSHGIGGLLKRVESAVRHFDPGAAQNTLMRLYGGVKSIHSHLGGIGDLAQETLAAIQMDVMVMGVIAYMAENTAFAQQAQRRHDLLLTTGQELQLAQKQLEALKAQTENALMQIEEVRTVTLPSLGFLGAIR